MKWINGPTLTLLNPALLSAAIARRISFGRNWTPAPMNDPH
ncbi:MAG: hypothetical protein WC586_11100 [Methanoregula sp.]